MFECRMLQDAAFRVCALIVFSVHFVATFQQPLQVFTTGKSTIKNYTIVVFNEENVQFTWSAGEQFSSRNLTFSYQFATSPWKLCQNYSYSHGLHVGCYFKVEVWDIFNICIYDNSTFPNVQAFNKTLRPYNYVMPNPPENVTIQRENNNMRFECSKPKSNKLACLRFALRYKSKFDEEWLHRENTCCNIIEQEIDPSKCYSFQVSLKWSSTCIQYRFVPYSSDWTPVMFWRNGSLVDSCSDEDSPTEMQTVYITILISLIILLKTFAILFFICKKKRVRERFMPLIPDPKCRFPGLFDDYNGNFQEDVFHPQVEVGINPGTSCIEDVFYFLIKSKLPDPKLVFRPPTLCLNTRYKIVDDIAKELHSKPALFYSVGRSKSFMQPEDKLEECLKSSIKNTFEVEGRTMSV